MDREDLRALAEEALKEFRSGVPGGESLWQQEIDDVYFDAGVITSLLSSAIQQYAGAPTDNIARTPADQSDFDFYFAPTLHGADSKETAKGFVRHFYGEIRDIVCNPKRQTEAAKLSRFKLGPTCAALSAFMMQRFGFNEPVAIGIGAYLLIVLLESTKGAFCKMTQQEVQSRVQNS